MLNVNRELKLSEQRQRTLLHEAENMRLAKQAQPNLKRSQSLFATLLVRLGRHLVQLGEQLQQQPETPIPLTRKMSAK